MPPFWYVDPIVGIFSTHYFQVFHSEALEKIFTLTINAYPRV